MEKTCSLDTQGVITQDVIVVFVPENNYSLPFVFSGGSCILNDIRMDVSKCHQRTIGRLRLNF